MKRKNEHSVQALTHLQFNLGLRGGKYIDMDIKMYKIQVPPKEGVCCFKDGSGPSEGLCGVAGRLRLRMRKSKTAPDCKVKRTWHC